MLKTNRSGISPMNLGLMQDEPNNSVVLAPQFTNFYTDSAKEPQYITNREPLKGWLYYNSRNSEPNVDRTNCVLGTGGVMAQNFNRLRFIGMGINWNIPNVNPRNNTFSFYSSNTGNTLHSVVLAEGYYELSQVSADLLMDNIVLAMNTITGTTGLTFSKIAVPQSPRTYQLIAAGGSFFFDLEKCAAITKGAQMYGIKEDGILSTFKVIGTMQMMYTQYVDVVSNTATKFQKIPSASTGGASSLLVRAYVGGNAWGVDFYAPRGGIQLDFSWNYSTPLYGVDFLLLDENGDKLYAPFDGKYLIWNITLAAVV